MTGSVPQPELQIRIPFWIAAAKAQSLEEAAFASGAALALLHVASGAPGLPLALWRERLALSAAEACAVFAGRSERAADLRDAVHLTRPRDSAGPAGQILQHWQRAVARPLSAAALQRALPGIGADQIADWLAAGQGRAVERAAFVLGGVLAEYPQDETSALILADAVLARTLGWGYLLPLLAAGLKPRDLRKEGQDLRLACHAALTASAKAAILLAQGLILRAERLQQVVPQLRAKGASEAVALFLSRDAVSPGALAGILPDRAARRFCERLVGLGVVRELTGRDSFRLYGL